MPGESEQELFDTVLRHPMPQFALGERLARIRPQLARVEGLQHHFNLRQFAKDGKCTVVSRSDLYNQLKSEWDSTEGVYDRPANAWLEVTWESHSFEVVVLSWPSKYYGDETGHVVMGQSREACEAFVEAVCRWNYDVRGEILVYSGECFSKSSKLYNAVMASSFDQLILQGSLKQQIRDDFTQFLEARGAYTEHGVPWKRGGLFIGPPGNGKTLCVKALIKLLGIPCLYIQSFAPNHGQPQHAIEEVFNRARKTTPCLLVLEDIDSLLSEQSRSFFLNELDGFAANTGIITLATTNHPERLDPAIVQRPSRFDRKYHFLLPDEATRANYIALWNERLRPKLRLTDAGIAQLAANTTDFSFAYIQEVFVSATMRWIATRDAAGLLPLALEQATVLREQMTSTAAVNALG